MKIYREITADLKENANKKRMARDKTFHKNDGHRSYGIKRVKKDAIYNKHKEVIEELSCADIFKLASKFYESDVEEVVMAGNYVLENRLDCFNKKNLGKLDEFVAGLISWSTVDDFAIDVLQPLLKQYPKEVLKLLKKWNKSDFIWKQRMSVVAFVRTVGESGKFTDEALGLCDNLIDSEEDLIQKAVGWCLKDIMRGEKKSVLEYVKELRRNGYPSTITLYAIRDLKGKEREEILKIKFSKLKPNAY